MFCFENAGFGIERRRGLKIALLCLFTATVAAILAVTVTFDNPLNITIVGRRTC